MNNISKSYGDNQVLKDVSLKVKPGEIHALLGENGAGKSTLMNILFGMPVITGTGGFKGELKIDGKLVNIATPHQAIDLGIGMVHQEFMLIPGFTVTENIKLNREISHPNLASRLLGSDLESLDTLQMGKDARTALDKIGISISENELIKSLPVGYMQFVEIAREIDKSGVKLLVFDEPTAVLTESEADILIQVMQTLANEGIGIIFITHRLGEVMKSAQTITVLRDGRLAASVRNEDTSIGKLASLMVGRDGAENAGEQARQFKSGAPLALSVRDLYVDMPGENLRGLDLDVYEGEILGIGGLAGQGKIGFPNGIMGICPASGKVEFFGEPLQLNCPRGSLEKGIAMVSEDRRGVGLLLDESIEDNIVFSAMQINGDYLTPPPFQLKQTRKIRQAAQQVMKELDIRATSSVQPVGTLSGGNQQKVCIARALALNPRFLFVSEPTRGIDIGAKQLVIQTLRKLNRELNITIVMVSSELLELKSICDRIAIITEGKLAAMLDPQASSEEFGLAMSGIAVPEE
ncbi:MAG: sugar ABC transporter ATP-binding protein [Clostridiales bacterium]|nr:sugar ABC transporter ATP-binding protein [Clostridiales bacterium]